MFFFGLYSYNRHNAAELHMRTNELFFMQNYGVAFSNPEKLQVSDAPRAKIWSIVSYFRDCIIWAKTSFKKDLPYVEREIVRPKNCKLQIMSLNDIGYQ